MIVTAIRVVCRELELYSDVNYYEDNMRRIDVFMHRGPASKLYKLHSTEVFNQRNLISAKSQEDILDIEMDILM